MADSAALRARRSRNHRKGDHSLCLPGRCKAVVEVPVLSDEPEPASEVREVNLGQSGSRLWRDVTAAGEFDPLRKLLLLEACRIADRLETLDRQLHGDAWLRFRHNESGAEVTVYVDRVLAEAREQASTLRGIVVELLKSVGKAPANPKGGGKLASVTSLIPNLPAAR